MRAVPSLCAMLLAATATGAEPASPPVQRQAPLSEVVLLSQLTIQASVADDGHEVALSQAGGKEKDVVRVELPREGLVSEIRMTRWINAGIAMAIEKRHGEPAKSTYYWATVFISADGKIGKPVVGQFKISDIDYEIGGVVNMQSDSICITLLRHERREGWETVTGYAYVNNCPVSPNIVGQLYPFQLGSEQPAPTAKKSAK